MIYWIDYCVRDDDGMYPKEDRKIIGRKMRAKNGRHFSMYSSSLYSYFGEIFPRFELAAEPESQDSSPEQQTNC